MTETNKMLTIQSLVPTTFEQVDALAKRLSESNLLPKALKGNPADVAIIILTGLDLGLGVMVAIRGINVIEGKAVLSADLTSALVQRNPICEYMRLVKSTDTEATYETLRRGHKNPISLTYTIAQATRAGLAKKQNWMANPSDMLRARCVSKICRAVYPDLVQGVYNEDEAEEIAENERIANGEVIDVTGGTPDYDASAQSIVDRINMACLVEQLKELVPEIRKLPKDYQKRIHVPYKEREAAILRGDVGPDDALPDFDASQTPQEGPATPDGDT